LAHTLQGLRRSKKGARQDAKAQRKALLFGVLIWGVLSLMGADTRPPVPLKAFSHKKHLALGNVGPVIAGAIEKGTYLSVPPAGLRAALNTSNPCQACHRGLEQSDDVSQVNMPQMADCLVCHNTVEPPFSCSFCHTAEAKLKPATHVADFLDSHPKQLAALGKENCAVCHARKFRCLGCH
jgi:hypothetical protein